MSSKEISSIPGIVRIIKKGGIPSTSEDAAVSLRDLMCSVVNKLISASLTYMEHENRKTLFLRDLVQSIELLYGIKYYNSSSSVACKDVQYITSKDGKTTKRRKVSAQMRMLQKQSDCLLLQKSPFRRYVVNEKNSLSKGINLSKEFMASLQSFVESFFVDFVIDCSHIVFDIAERKRLLVKDIKVVKKIKKI